MLQSNWFAPQNQIKPADHLAKKLFWFRLAEVAHKDDRMCFDVAYIGAHWSCFADSDPARAFVISAEFTYIRCNGWFKWC